MIQRVKAFTLVAFLGTGCGVGDDAKFEPIDPNPNKKVCTDAFRVTGTFAEGTTPARPIDPDTNLPIGGCWPVGKWTFTVALDPTDDNILDLTGDGEPERCGKVAGTSAATFDARYSFDVTRTAIVFGDGSDGFEEKYVLEGAVPDGELGRWNGKIFYRLKVTEGGGGDCEGGLELYSTDKKSYWNLKPAQTGAVLGGVGDFALYEEPQEL